MVPWGWGLRLAWSNQPEHAVEGLAAFSHVWLLWVFHRNGGEAVKAKVRPPRLDGAPILRAAVAVADGIGELSSDRGREEGSSRLPDRRKL